jgi:hypothetical protein
MHGCISVNALGMEIGDGSREELHPYNNQKWLRFKIYVLLLRTMWTVTAKDDLNLMVIRSDGVLDYRRLQDLLHQIYLDDEGKYASYDRFADLSSIETIDVDIDTVVKVVQTYRGFKPLTNEVKVAVYLPFGMTGSLAQIFKLLTETDTLFNLQIFRSVEECAEYLEVDQSMLSG